MKTRLILLLTSALVAAVSADAQSARELWRQRFVGADVRDNQVASIAVDGAGNVIITGTAKFADGTSGRCYTARYSGVGGALLWENFHSGRDLIGAGGTAVATDSAGNVIVTGFARRSPAGYPNLSEFITIKYAAEDGNLIWERHHHGAGIYLNGGLDVAVDHADNVIVTGGVTDAQDTGHSYTAKYAGIDGVTIWEQLGPRATEAARVVLDGAGNAIVSGGASLPVVPASPVACGASRRPLRPHGDAHLLSLGRSRLYELMRDSANNDSLLAALAQLHPPYPMALARSTPTNGRFR